MAIAHDSGPTAPTRALPPHPAPTPAHRLGFWTALFVAILTPVTFALALIAIPITGPMCVDGCVAYPYADLAARFPHDYLWMYPAIVLMLAFVVLIACLHACAAPQRRVLTQIAVAFATLSAGVIAADYYLQIAVVQPSFVNHETEGVALLTQFNTHGVFIGLEDFGYFVMSLVFLFAAFALTGRSRVERALRWLFLLAPLLTVGAYVVMYAIYGTALEYRFEVVAISINWITLIVGGALLSRWFARGGGGATAGQ